MKKITVSNRDKLYLYGTGNVIWENDAPAQVKNEIKKLRTGAAFERIYAAIALQMGGVVE